MTGNSAPSRASGVDEYLKILRDPDKKRSRKFEFALGPAPYRGLNWFDEESDRLLFGRDDAATNVLERVGSTPTVGE